MIGEQSMPTRGNRMCKGQETRERERMALGAARSSTWNGGHRLEAYGVESRLQMCL